MKKNEVSNNSFDDQPVCERVVEELLTRAKIGYVHYGRFLTPSNGRNALRDLLDELLDASMYVTQRLMEEEMSDEGEKESGHVHETYNN